MNPKIEKVKGEIEKAKAKMAGIQAHLRDLERKKTELENADIVAMFRKEMRSEDAIAEFMLQMSRRSETEKATGKETVNEDRPD